MRILLDECVPRPLKKELPGHDVRTVVEMGWAGKRNGELLQLMAANSFSILMTVDQNLKHQQNLRAGGVAVVVLFGTTSRLADLQPLMPAVLRVISTIQPGDLLEIRA